MFRRKHLKDADTLRTYQAAGRKGSVRLERAVLDELDPSAAPWLYANNSLARINFAAVAKRRIETLAAAQSDAQLLWVTLCPQLGVVREDEAGNYRIRRLHAWTHQALRGLNYIGMVEAALYTNVRALFSTQRAVSWHVHVLVWGVSKAAIHKLKTDLNGKYQSLLPGVPVADYYLVSHGVAVEKVLYMMKSPQSEHRVYPRKGEVVDRITGEVTRKETGRFKQKKRQLRPGDMARMCNVLAGKFLHKLAFAGGQGRELLEAIRHEALEPLRKYEDAEAARQAHKGGRPPHRGRGEPPVSARA